MSMTLSYLFDDATDYQFDVTLLEFTGATVALLLQGANPLVATTTLLATYPTAGSADAQASLGLATATLVGAPTVTGGAVQFRPGAERSVSYPVMSNVNLLQVGAVRLEVTPQYTGAPAAVQRLVDLGSAASLLNRITISHTGTTLTAELWDTETKTPILWEPGVVPDGLEEWAGGASALIARIDAKRKIAQNA